MNGPKNGIFLMDSDKSNTSLGIKC